MGKTLPSQYLYLSCLSLHYTPAKSLYCTSIALLSSAMHHTLHCTPSDYWYNQVGRDWTRSLHCSTKSNLFCNPKKICGMLINVVFFFFSWEISLFTKVGNVPKLKVEWKSQTISRMNTWIDNWYVRNNNNKLIHIYLTGSCQSSLAAKGMVC